MTLALCPGSFDPPTNGHVDIVERASRLFDQVVVAVLNNPAKRPLLEVQERCALLERALAHCRGVQVLSHAGLLVDLARDLGAAAIVKGLRSTSDMGYELQMAHVNATLLPAADTLFIAASPRWGYVSSSLAKEVARYGGDVSGFVPAPVADALKRHFAQNVPEAFPHGGG